MIPILHPATIFISLILHKCVPYIKLYNFWTLFMALWWDFTTHSFYLSVVNAVWPSLLFYILEAMLTWKVCFSSPLHNVSCYLASEQCSNGPNSQNLSRNLLLLPLPESPFSSKSRKQGNKEGNLWKRHHAFLYIPSSFSPSPLLSSKFPHTDLLL